MKKLMYKPMRLAAGKFIKADYTMTMTGTLYVIAAPSGAGKTSLVNALIKTLDHIKISISYTTRPIRPGEQNNIDYHFVTEAEFKSMIQQQQFLEYAEVYGHYYGTSREWVLARLKRGEDIILEIDWQGAQQIRKMFPQSVSIFILPPSLNILQERLQQRRQDSEAVIQQRFAAACSDIEHYGEFDYLLINDVFDTALGQLQCIVRAHRLRKSCQTIKYAELLSELTKNG